MFDLNAPVYRPLWVRIVLTAICLGWAVFEYRSGAVGFALLFAAMGLYAGWCFFITFDPDRADRTPAPETAPDPTAPRPPTPGADHSDPAAGADPKMERRPK
ncbi:hypothetical protein BFP70_19875 [Thioclava sp. SK-1]|uniref:hypothetical protein n=1 Tax=Thioclava sp. SK-1 TaxID=1889770 RepID=UPI000824AD75|nr:hypothetical protein [Thioclava sp. SK-1]OCX67373.1 hypothetical protein BFP70_19875 [Thioclava sp. SK-1]